MDGMQSLVGLQAGTSRVFTEGFWADGTETAPGASFLLDQNTGIYRIGPDEWGITAGGLRVMRFGKDIYGARVDIGNSVFPLVGFQEGNIFSVSTTTTVNNNGTIALAIGNINDGVAGVGGVGIPDSSGMTINMFQTAATAKGAMRAIEAHVTRIQADPAASTCMLAELGIHTSVAGNPDFPFISVNAYSRGLWLSSTQEANMQGVPGGPYAAVPVDVGLFITGSFDGLGQGGFRYPIACTDTLNVLRFALADNGTMYLSTVGNAAAPQLTFLDDTDTGIYRIGANGLGLTAGGVEQARMGISSFGVTTGLDLNGVISPAQLTANTNDWVPTGVFSASVIRVGTDASRNLTGLQALSHRVILLHNTGGFNLVLKNNDAASAAANRFFTPAGADYTLGVNEGVMLWYDDTSTCWRIHGT